MTVINTPIIVDGDRLERIQRKLEALEAKFDRFKIPDPSTETYLKAKDCQEIWHVSRTTERKIRERAISLGLINPVELRSGMIRYRKSEVLNLDLRKLKRIT